MPRSWLTSGNAYGLQDGAVYLQKYGTLSPFVWGGRCMRLDEGTEALGGLSVSTRFNPRGGVERDTVRAEPPGDVSTTLVMKSLQADRAKSDLRRCYWNVDRRAMCGGLDRDAWKKWEEITRYCYAKMSERSIPALQWEGDEDALVSFGVAALSVEDIFHVGGSEKTAIAGKDGKILDVDVCQPERCPDRCDDQEDCIVVAVTEAVTVGEATNSHLLVNLAGGDDDDWTAVTLTAFGVNDANAVKCLGSFVVAISTADTSIIYSDDLGATQVNIDQATYTAWTTNPPECIDAIDQTFVVMGGDNGYAYVSYDAARTWETVLSGEATTNDITRIMIARDNPQVIYAASNAADVVIKSENGGRTWFACALTGTAGTGITALYVINQSLVLAGTDAGEVFESRDGGTTWTEQAPLPGMYTAATTTVEDIVGCGCGVLFLSTDETTAAHTAARIYRNVDNGASGRWYEEDDIGALTAATGPITALACCGPNHLVGVGGEAATSSSAILVQ